MRRVKNVAYDDDWDDGDWGGGDWGGSSWGAAKKTTAKPAAKKAAAKPAAGKASAKAAAATATTAKPAAPAASKAAIEDLQLALKPAGVSTDRIEKALGNNGGKAENAFLRLLSEELDAGRWMEDGLSAAPAPSATESVDAALDAAAAPEAPAKKEETETFSPPARKTEAKAKAKVAADEAKPAAAASSSTTTAAAAAPAAKEEKEEVAEPLPAVDGDGDARPSMSLVVAGHVDAGKSTMMGHLLCLVGEVSSKVLHKFEKESKQMNKASFAYAWVLDEGSDERERGVTIDVCVKHFATTSKRFTILDAPGHRDFVPNMIQGAVQADVAILVADVSHFEAGFEKGGQTKEHLQLVRALGLSQLVVAVNKLDTADWSETVFENIKARLDAFITGPECGFKAANVRYVPVSGFTGENMVERKEPKLSSWYSGPTLVGALDDLPAIKRPDPNGPLRIPISDLYKSGSNAVASGKVEAGRIAHGQKVLLLPSNEQTSAKNLTSRNAPSRLNQAGDYLDAITLPVELQFASIGGVITNVNNPVPVVDTFQAKIMVFDVDIPIMKGQQFMCYIHVETLRCTLLRLEQLIVKGKPQDKRPKCLQKGNTAVVQLRVDRKICLEPVPSDGVMTSLSRLVLRDKGRTVAAGAVIGVV